MSDVPDINRAIAEGIDRGDAKDEDTCATPPCRRPRAASSLYCEDCQCNREESTGLPGFTGRAW